MSSVFLREPAHIVFLISALSVRWALGHGLWVKNSRWPVCVCVYGMYSVRQRVFIYSAFV